MITTRERLTISEVWRAASSARRVDLHSLIAEFLPLQGRHYVLASQGKAAFEQIVIAANLQGRRLLLPAFFPDDFVGVFLKYRITPVFVDVDPQTYHLDLGAIRPEQLEGASALLVEHTFGLAADGGAYRSFCDRHNLLLIEDCARALGAVSRGRLAGSFGHFAMFSLPKCTPVRAGGIALGDAALPEPPAPATLGVTGLLHALTLIKYPLTSSIERSVYAWLADSPVYPREVGNYQPLPVRTFDGLGRFMLKAFMPCYADALVSKRRCASIVRNGLASHGFTFQADGEGEHIYTSLSAEPPAACDADQLRAFLVRHGVKASAMWRDALGVCEFGRKTWHAEPDSTPVAARLARRLIQFPVSRFHTPAQSNAIVDLCTRFVERPTAFTSIAPSMNAPAPAAHPTGRGAAWR